MLEEKDITSEEAVRSEEVNGSVDDSAEDTLAEETSERFDDSEDSEKYEYDDKEEGINFDEYVGSADEIVSDDNVLGNEELE